VSMDVDDVVKWWLLRERELLHVFET
jgi:hypothetical protein